MPLRRTVSPRSLMRGRKGVVDVNGSATHCVRDRIAEKAVAADLRVRQSHRMPVVWRRKLTTRFRAKQARSESQGVSTTGYRLRLPVTG